MFATPSRPPAWRAIQSENWSVGLHGAPPCLADLDKVGQGHDSRWLLATYRGAEPQFDVFLKLDRNPDEPCYKLHFHPPSSARDEVGHMLLAAEEHASALRGMRIAERCRGLGYSQLLLAAWLRMCIDANVNPSTRTINKPLLSLSLARLGFSPANGRGQLVRVTNARRLRDCQRPQIHSEGHAEVRSAYVRTTFEAPPATELLIAVERRLESGTFELAASSEALHRALTLRGAAGGKAPQLSVSLDRTAFKHIRHHSR